jgi:hypothetical protein
MDMLSLTDSRNYNAQINCVLNLKGGNILVAGEDGLIKIVTKNKNGVYLNKMLDAFGYLANIEEVKELENGDLICVETLGSVGIYKKIIDKNKYKEVEYELKIIKSEIIDDCFYYLNILNSDQVEIWGETGRRYIINIT